jgi:hypothetical protein
VGFVGEIEREQKRREEKRREEKRRRGNGMKKRSRGMREKKNEYE